MKRLIGALVVLGLIGGAVGIGLASAREAPRPRVADVHELIRQLSDHGFGCRDVETNVPGVLGLSDVRLAACNIEDSRATLYVFDGSSALFAQGYESGTPISWVIGENWVVVLDTPELAIAIADALGARSLYDPAQLAAATGSRLQCPEGDLVEATSVLIGGPGIDGTPVDAVRVSLRGFRPTDVLVEAEGRRGSVLIFRDDNLIGKASAFRSDKGGWLVDGSEVCASAGIRH